MVWHSLGSQSVGESVKAELRAVRLGLVAVVDHPVDESGVSVVLQQHLNRLPTKNLNL